MFNSENNFDLNCAASRLLLNLLPGLNEADMVQDVVSFLLMCLVERVIFVEDEKDSEVK